jgi:PAS domain S-box-containing protein
MKTENDRFFSASQSNISEGKIDFADIDGIADNFNTLLAVLPVAIYVCDREGRITFYNRKASEIWGQSPQPFSDKRFCGSYKLYKPNGQYLPPDQTPMALAIRKGKSFSNQEVIVEHPDGRRVFALANIEAIFDSSGNISGAINSFSDITELQEKQDALDSQQRLVNGIIENIPVMLCIWDSSLESFRLNNELKKITGWTESDAAGGDFMSKLYPDPEYRRKVQEFMLSLEGGWRDFEITTKDNEIIETSWSNVILSDGRCIGIGIDIRQRKQAEEKLRSSERRFRTMADGLPHIIWVHDAQGRQEFANRTFYEFFGIDENNIGPDTWSRLLHPDDAASYRNRFLTSLKDRVAFHAEARVRPADGQWRWIESWGQPRYSDSGEFLGFVGTSVDITDRKESQNQLKELNESLEHRVAQRTSELRALANQLTKAENTERKRLARILHDNIQQLVVGARMQVQLMKHYDDVGKLHSAAESVSDLLRETLNASRSLAIDLSPPVLHQAGLIGGLNWLRDRVYKKNLFTINLKIDDDAEPAAEETRFLLFDCVRELVLNSMKHSGKDWVDVSLLREDQDQIKLVVIDQGKGFDPEMLRKRRSQDITFGLFSIRERLAHIGGTMDIVSSPGNGTKMTLSVFDHHDEPADDKDDSSDGSAEQSPPMKIRRESQQCNVLICDDHQIMREGLLMLLQFESDIRVIGQARNADEATAIVGKLTPDAVIMNLGFGEINGIEAIKRILAKNPRTNIIVLATNGESLRKSMLKAGACAYINQSDPSERLIETLRDVCGLPLNE